MEKGAGKLDSVQCKTSGRGRNGGREGGRE